MRCKRSLLGFLIIFFLSVSIFFLSNPVRATVPFYLGIATRFTNTTHTTGWYEAVNATMVQYGMNVIRLGSGDLWGSSYTWHSGDAVDWFLNKTNFNVIVDRHHTIGLTSLTSVQNSTIIADCIADAVRWVAYGDRLMIEPVNEYGGTDFYDVMQPILNAFRATGNTTWLIFDRMGTSLNNPDTVEYYSWEVLNDSWSKTIQGAHWYMDPAATQGVYYGERCYNMMVNGFVTTGQPIIGTEEGANMYEKTSFTNTNVAALNNYLQLCADAGFGNLIWMNHELDNLAEYVAHGLVVPSGQWQNAETWSINAGANATWRSVESWSINAQGTGHWSNVESWSVNLQSGANWTTVENWTIAAYSHTEAWHSAENWTITLNATAAWFDVETWSVNVSTYLAGFHDVETWNVTVNAQKQTFSWSPDIQFHLTLPDTYIGFADTAYFDSFTFSEDYLTLVNVYMDSGTEISSLKIEMTGGNVSFTALSYLDLVSFTFNANPGTTVTLSLTGLNSMPYNVTIDGEGYAVGTRWTWDGTVLTVSYVMPTSSSNIVLSWAAITTAWQNVESWNIDLNPAGAIISGVTWYYRSNTITANSITGYELSETMDSTLSSVAQNLGVSSDSIQFGFMAYMVNSHNVSVSLTGDVPTAIITRSDVGVGFDSATVAVPETALTLGYDTIDVKLYIRLSSGGWLLSAEFTSQRLMYTRLIGSTWQFNLYTNKSLDGSGNTIATASWGDSTHVSGISGLSFKTPTPQELSIYYAGRGDWIHAVLYPYMIYAGDAVYGLGFLFVAGVLYLRHKKWEVILVCLFLFGGSTGLGFLIPDAAYRLLYMVVALAITWLLVKVFK